jgi:preprotein translocase subunit SecA
LAKRDAENEKNRKIYESLGIKVDHCIKDKNSHERGPKKCYLADVVYGDAHNFQADILSDKYMLEGTRNNREYDVIIVDEIDSMFVDNYATSTLLSGEKPYMKRLNYILISMWIHLSFNIDLYHMTKDDIIQNKGNLMSSMTKIGEKILEDNKSLYSKYLYDFAKDQLKEKWPNSAIEAALMVENERYLVNNGKIEPVDNENTGVIQHNTHLSYGLQQFLQLKHNCAMTAVSNISSYLSNVGFFKLYINKEKNINNIFGLTGTLGSQTAQDLLHDIYNLDFFFVPPASQRMLNQLTPRLECNEIDWMKSIINTCLREAKFGREVLIICMSIKIVQDIKKQIEKNYKGPIYTLKDDVEAEQNLEGLKPGSIIITTNLAGRGTDIPVSEEILKKGGMHVCLTFLPTNTRVQEQAF